MPLKDLTFLGDTVVEARDTVYWGYGPAEWALCFLGKYQHIEGEHHKDWLIDQVTRVLIGERVIITEARWSNGIKEYRLKLEHSPKMDRGIAP